jgi:TPR repeat protein
VIEQATEGPRSKTPLIFVVGGAIALALVAGLSRGYFVKESRPETADAKLQIALQAFRAGNDATAITLLTPLANEGNAKAQYWLADIYDDDDPGVKPDRTKAQVLLEKSAAQGFAPAERRLGQLDLRGTATLQDFGKAQSWLHKAATAGDARAQEHLGHIYALGLGVPQDMSQAYGWYENAAVHGDGLAERMRDDLLKRMSPAEIDKGEQIAKEISASIKPAKS